MTYLVLVAGLLLLVLANYEKFRKRAPHGTGALPPRVPESRIQQLLRLHHRKWEEARYQMPPSVLLTLVVLGGYVVLFAYPRDELAVWIVRGFILAWILGWFWLILTTFGPQKEWHLVRRMDAWLRWFMGLPRYVDR